MDNVLTVEQIDKTLYALKLFVNTRPEFRACIKGGSRPRVASKRMVRMPYSGIRISANDIRAIRGALKREKRRIIKEETI